MKSKDFIYTFKSKVMKLNQKQKAIVQMINNKKYTIEYIEERYKEKPESINRFSYSLGLKESWLVEAFMTAVDGIIDYLDNNDKGLTT